MQALFYIVFFGVIYALIGFVTFGATETTAELTQRHLTSVKQMFEDVEYAINENHLRENVDIIDLLDNNDLLDLTKVAPYVSWSPTELTQSPWNTEYRVCQRVVNAPDRTTALTGALDAAQRSTILYADNAGYLAANVYEFILLSTGPNRQFDLSSVCTFADGAFVGEFTDLATVIESIGNNDTDDIVHIFSTREPLRRIAAAYVSAEQKVVEVIYNGYAQRFIEVSDSGQVGGYKDYTDKENAVKEKQTDATGALVNPTAPAATSYTYRAINAASYEGCYDQFKATYCADASSELSKLSRGGYDNLCTIADVSNISLSTALMFCYLSDKTITTRNAAEQYVHADFVDGSGNDVKKPDILGFQTGKHASLRSKYDFNVEEICSNPFGSGCNADGFDFVNLEVIHPSYATGGTNPHPNAGEAIADRSLHPMFRTVLQFTGAGAQDWQVYREVYIDALNAIE